MKHLLLTGLAACILFSATACGYKGNLKSPAQIESAEKKKAKETH